MIHHMNPIALEDITSKKDYIIDPEFLISTSRDTHNAIHYGDARLLQENTIVERAPNDTCPWRK